MCALKSSMTGLLVALEDVSSQRLPQFFSLLELSGGRPVVVSMHPCVCVCVSVSHTGIVSMRVLRAAAAPQTLQTIVCDLQDKATVHHTVG